MAEELKGVDISQELNYWGARVYQRILKNFETLKINRQPKDGYTGNLRRSIWWTVFNAAGGNQAMIQFFFLKYGDFVQWGVGNGQKRWPVPRMTKMEALQSPDSRRKAKPFIRSEVRHHVTWLQKRLAEQYAYNGALYIVKSLADGAGDRSITEKWVRENEKELAKGLTRVMGLDK